MKVTYEDRSKSRSRKYKDKNLSNYSRPNHFIYQALVLSLSISDLQTFTYLNLSLNPNGLVIHIIFDVFVLFPIYLMIPNLA